MSTKKIKLPGDKSEKQIIEQIIRVNHAGEYGARRIYQGQIKYNKNSEADKILKHMLEQELNHLNYFSEQIVKRNVRPSILNPLWHIGGYILGAVTSKIDVKTAMACTEAVETVIDEHYKEQLDILKTSDEQELLEKIENFRQEEVEHKEIALENKAKSSPLYELVSDGIKVVSKLSIFLAKRF